MNTRRAILRPAPVLQVLTMPPSGSPSIMGNLGLNLTRVIKKAISARKQLEIEKYIQIYAV